ncbi:hypothetical protein A3D80_04135 [Candidatus Roizmanbacteria bacterium RIFCSPHIGHO2_02_FULL_40_13b]|uniref:DUF2283 domain-containing protein n=1 Tax=Candidatus Roizmanbacteria bacterium RIFCSPHIGHO2_01_FULL_39_24 TaxID=1802032 RepID=A0A1F7GKT3_9BACT|nr:MAG: hypothetical protein A2799_00290 [Candidatus Roizmanbacteria bacterium RIFCSPHIGHO2_01_FULL_39_24]OGK27982.1 MAG: hypothetical protein A3D80_04135 [Candidatus Roizmanbacteria bacterium RIFCSPHIGHO2_02_FULL_40_13b]OGK49226.1 MAG: hypothetical protein A3A56_04500 [Candidatus Roizmanbacteria bacterium RIFCSPLOWO2_01_FULL_40_32]OGK57196.1 MAG: hypothetical protein A3H83_03015 [Candidatus Roizmanbacteria bacterium RIFCSPLOWO2_02_FULL_39_8]
MKVNYNSEDDVLMIDLNDKKIDYAEQTGGLIVHFSPEREMVLIEILDASKFLPQIFAQVPKKVIKSIFAPKLGIAYKNR